MRGPGFSSESPWLHFRHHKHIHKLNIERHSFHVYLILSPRRSASHTWGYCTLSHQPPCEVGYWLTSDQPLSFRLIRVLDPGLPVLRPAVRPPVTLYWLSGHPVEDTHLHRDSTCALIQVTVATYSVRKSILTFFLNIQRLFQVHKDGGGCQLSQLLLSKCSP